MKQKLIDRALILVAIIEFQTAKLRSINSNIQKMYGDFSPSLPLMTEDLEKEVVGMLDLILGEDLASYYLYECSGMKEGGRVIEKDGTEWPIAHKDDLKKYVYHINKIKLI